MKRAVVGIILNEKKELLLLRRRDVPDVWVLPGGGVESNETPEAAVLRESQEETGYHVSLVRKISEYTPLNRLAQYTYLFECKIETGEVFFGDETKEIRFFGLQSLPKNLFIVHQDWIQDFLLNSNSVIHKAITRVTYWELFKYFAKHPLQVIRLLLSRLGIPINSK